MKRPAFQFYPADWRKDVELQSCSVAAQGLWINAMCVAHECEPYGVLAINGRPMTSVQIGQLVGLGKRDCDRLLEELLHAGVCSRSEDGAIFSRRMVRDEDLRQRRASGGQEGAEHGQKGAEHGAKGGRPKGSRGDKKPPSEPPPSSSSSSSASTVSEANASGGSTPPEPVDLIFGLGLPALQAAGVSDKNGRSMLGMMRKQHGDAAVVAAIQRMADERPLEPVAWLQAVLRSSPVKAVKPAQSFQQQNTLDKAKRASAWTGGRIGGSLVPRPETLEMEAPDARRLDHD